MSTQGSSSRGLAAAAGVVGGSRRNHVPGQRTLDFWSRRRSEVRVEGGGGVVASAAIRMAEEDEREAAAMDPIGREAGGRARAVGLNDDWEDDGGGDGGEESLEGAAGGVWTSGTVASREPQRQRARHERGDRGAARSAQAVAGGTGDVTMEEAPGLVLGDDADPEVTVVEHGDPDGQADASGGGDAGGSGGGSSSRRSDGGQARPSAAPGGRGRGAGARVRSASARERTTCPFCAAPCQLTNDGLDALARHIAQRHVSVRARQVHADWLHNKLEKCGCGRWIRVAAACECRGTDRERVGPGDPVVGKAMPRAPAASSTMRRNAQAARAEAALNVAAPAVCAWLRILSRDVLQRVDLLLETWGGSETSVHIPLRLRPELAEIVAALLDAMVEGDEVASLMMKCLPKLLFHQTAIRKRGGPHVIRQRLGMLLNNHIEELAESIRAERAAPARVGAKRMMNDATKKVTKVKELARDGALSKAIRRLDDLEIAKYEPDEARRWASVLIPTIPDDAASLGARPITGRERRELQKVKTCADKVSLVTPQDASDEDEEADDPAGVAPGGEKKNKTPPKLGAYADGVRFAALSAPGPSGLRPEHLKELATCRRARSRHAFERAMNKFVASGIRGELPQPAWWITDSAVTFVRKPGAAPDAAPRPLRVGEVLRRWIAKRITVAERDLMRKLFASRRQFGVACPGGTEILLHHRMITCGGHVDNDIADWDVDLKNCYGNLFWSAIDSSVQRHIPGALPWARWLHARQSRVILPGGASYHTERGAEQGDPLGGAFAAAVIVDVCERAQRSALTIKQQLGTGPYSIGAASAAIRTAWTLADEGASPHEHAVLLHRREALNERLTAMGADAIAEWDVGEVALRGAARDEHLRMIDCWYIDDGHLRAHLVDGDIWLMAFDAQGSTVGIIRSDTKSLFRPASAISLTPPYTAVTCLRRQQLDHVKYLGVEIGNEDDQFRRSVIKMSALHDKIREIDDPAIELTLTQQCADVGRVMHLLRAVGPTGPIAGISVQALEQMDIAMTAAASQIARTDLTDEAAQQAGWSVKLGGLGLRPGSLVALPAHLASLVEAEPFVRSLAEAMAQRGIPAANNIADLVRDATDTLLGPHLPDELWEQLNQSIEEATEAADRKANTILGADAGPEDAEVAGAGPAASAAARLPRRRGSTAARVGGRHGPAGPGSAGQPPAAAAAAAGGGEAVAADPDDPGGGRRPNNDTGQGDGAPPHTKRLQHQLVLAFERQQVRLVINGLRGLRGPPFIRYKRLIDLGNIDTKHGWMQAINPAHGPVLRPPQFITCLRLRLGLPVVSYDGAARCSECNIPFSADAIGDHALCCARGQSVIGHDRVRDLLANLALISDPSTAIEQRDAPATGSGASRTRPADILIRASPIGSAGLLALDVGICCPHTHAAIVSPDLDVLSEYARLKHARYDDAATRAGWIYRPVTMSSFGRPHPDSLDIVHRLADAATRRFGIENAAKLEQSWWRNCSTLLAERAANMVNTCIPTIQLPPMLGGHDDELVVEVVGNDREVDVERVIVSSFDVSESQ